MRSPKHVENAGRFISWLVLVAATVSLVREALAYDRLFVSPHFILFYYGLPAAVLVAALVALTWRRMAMHVCLALVGAVAGGYAAEIAVRATDDGLNNTQKRIIVARAAAAARGQRFDSRVMSQVVVDLRAAGQTAYPTFGPTTFLYERSTGRAWNPPLQIDATTAVLPLNNIANVRSVYCNEGGEWFIFQSDRYGFNNDDRIWDQGDTAIAVLGDSFAQGACVPRGSSAVDVLGRRARSIVNLGVAGTGPLLQLAVLKEYGALLRPRAVVWFFYEGNDLHVNLDVERTFPYLQQYLDPSFRAGLAQHEMAVDRFLRSYVDAHFERMQQREVAPVVRRHDWRDVVRLAALRERLGLTACPSRSQDFGLYRRILGEGDRLVKSWGGQLYVVYLPASSDCDLFDAASRNQHWMQAKVHDVWRELGLVAIDVRRAFADAGKPARFWYYPGSHYNESGYAVVADQVAAALARRPQSGSNRSL